MLLNVEIMMASSHPDLKDLYQDLYQDCIRFQLILQNAVSHQPCVRKLGISLVLLNFLGCNCGW